MKIDTNANIYGLHKSLITPISAKSIEAINDYVGVIKKIPGYDFKAFIVEFKPIEKPNNYEIWLNPRSVFINYPVQLWVDIDFKYYRKVYKQVFHNFNLSNMVIDHITNRKFARLLDYKFTRLIHIDRGVNSSSGRGPETESVKNQKGKKDCEKRAYKAVIEYADPIDIVKILNIKTGGFPLKNVGEHLQLIYGE
ncbi:hypothetical protein KAI78_03635 [bacterium]|nr:hypothetical protein [bacterium]